MSGRGVVLAIVGGERAPRLRLRGPAGRVIEMPEQGPFRSKQAVAFRVAQQRTTFAVLTEPGTWSIESDRWRGSDADPARAGARRTRGARVRRGRRSRAPAAALLGRSIPGQRVRFFERAGNRLRLLDTASGNEGTLVFAPLDAPTPARRIVAAVEQDGRPREELTVARFSFAPPRVGRSRVSRPRGAGRSCACASGRPVARRRIWSGSC